MKIGIKGDVGLGADEAIMARAHGEILMTRLRVVEFANRVGTSPIYRVNPRLQLRRLPKSSNMIKRTARGKRREAWWRL
jgi:hypothetical protein